MEGTKYDGFSSSQGDTLAVTNCRDGVTSLLRVAVSVVDGIAVDSQNQLLFFTDTGRDIISAVTTHTSPPRQTAIVTEGLEEPRDIVVSPLDGSVWQ